MSTREAVKNYSPFELLVQYVSAADAGTAVVEEQTAGIPHYLLFVSGDERFMVNVQEVESVIKDEPAVKPLPFAPVWFKGLSSVRNEIVSIISFAEMWSGKRSTVMQKQYILLRGSMQGFMLEVDRLGGIKGVDVQEKELQRKFIDGECLIDGETWQRISTGALLEVALARNENGF